MQKCINFVEQQLKFFHFDGSIILKDNLWDWFHGGILESIDLRDTLFRKFKRSKLNKHKEIYNTAHNKLHTLILQKNRVVQKQIKYC